MSHDFLTQNIRKSALSPSAVKEGRTQITSKLEIIQNSTAFHGTFKTSIDSPNIDFEYINPSLSTLFESVNDNHQTPPYLQQKLHNIITTNDWEKNPLPSLVTSLEEDHHNGEIPEYYGFTIEQVGNKYHLSGRNITDKEMIRQQRLYNHTHDPLTGVLNDKGLNAVITTLEGNNRSDRPNSFTFAFLDLDGLKNVNDTQGHNKGDEYIRQFAKLLTDAFRETDYIFRIKGNTGDEFGILITSNNVDFLQSKLIEIRTSQTSFPFSFGIASKDRVGAENINLNELISQADTKMYQDKDQRKKNTQQLV